MLSKFGIENFELIKQSIHKFWGNNAVITNAKVIERPFDMFEIYLTINRRHNVLLSYDRSIVDISVQEKGEYVWLTDLTKEKVVEGFESCKQENLIHNFNILNETLQ